MGRYSIIADTGEKLVELLQRELVPEVVGHADEIGLRSPEEHGDVTLGIFLYDIRESEEIRQVRPAVVKEERLVRRPLYLSLFYMITAYCNSDVKYRLAQEQRILGKVIQTFHDYPLIPLRTVDMQESSGTDIHIQMLRMEPDDKSKIWNFPHIGNRMSLFYKVAPVVIDSGISTEVHRVTDVDVNVSTIKK